MAGKSVKQIVDKIMELAGGYVAVKQVGADFESEMQNYLTQDGRFPAVFVALPQGNIVQLHENTNTTMLRVFCLDLIQADRKNIVTIVSDCCLILGDLHKDLMDGDDIEFDVPEDPYIETQNNSRLDYLAGGVMDLPIEAGVATQCEIAKDEDYEQL